MEYIAHRINSVAELKKLPAEYGVEVDLRDNLDGSIYIAHDPFIPGENFEDYLKHYKHGTLILNIKSERIEIKVLELIKKYAIPKYFFLDSSFPMVHYLSESGESNIAIRFSEFEGLDTIRKMERKVRWVWVDCFNKLPINKKVFTEFKRLGYYLCLVSPELQGRDGEIEDYKDYLKNENIVFDAICTKQYNISRWQ